MLLLQCTRLPQYHGPKPMSSNKLFLPEILSTGKSYSSPHRNEKHMEMFLVIAFPKAFTCRVPQSNLKCRYGDQPAEFKWVQVSRVVSRPGIRGLQRERPPGRGYSCVLYCEQRYLDMCAGLSWVSKMHRNQVHTQFSKTSHSWVWDCAKVRVHGTQGSLSLQRRQPCLPACSLQFLLVAYGIHDDVLI